MRILVQRAARVRILGVIGALLMVGSCDGGPKAGEIVFVLATPNQDDGALQFRVTAAEPNTLGGVAAGCAGCQVFTEVVSETEIRGVLIGDVVPGDALRVLVSDRKARQAYAGQVVAVASRTYALGSSSGYALTAAD
jgi:hypothetical protein